ncbi:MAG: hypothetical protein ACRDNG_04470 [Gaiellaceae bacterium]
MIPGHGQPQSSFPRKGGVARTSRQTPAPDGKQELGNLEQPLLASRDERQRPR